MKRGFTIIEVIGLITILFVFGCTIIALVINAGSLYGNARYIVKHQGSTYFVESYTKENNGSCIYLAEKELRLCGDYSIEKINKEE